MWDISAEGLDYIMLLLTWLNEAAPLLFLPAKASIFLAISGAVFLNCEIPNTISNYTWKCPKSSKFSTNDKRKTFMRDI